MDPDSRQEQGWWDAKAAREQRDTGDEAINRALRRREIERRLPGVRTVLSVGTGAGPFTIPLAERGLRVIHLGFPTATLDLASTKAAGVSGIEFVEGNAVDSSRFPDRSLTWC